MFSTTADPRDIARAVQYALLASAHVVAFGPENVAVSPFS
jgi:hypothetical protein